MEKLFNIIIILCVLYFLNYYIKRTKSNFENTFFNKDMSKDMISHKVVSNKVKFDYNLRNIDKQFLHEQDKGVVMNSSYPNTWLESNINNNPVYNSREKDENNNVSPFEYLQTKTSNGYEFNKNKFNNIDGIMEDNTTGKTLQEVYDNSMVDYKKLVPMKDNIPVDDDNMARKGASELSYITSDMWLYKDERQENGGEIVDGLYAFDNNTNNVAIY